MRGRGAGNISTDPWNKGQANGMKACGGGYQTAVGRHLDGSNFLMADGHVKWLKGDRVSTSAAATNPSDVQNSMVKTYATGQAEGTENGTHTVTFSPT